VTRQNRYLHPILRFKHRPLPIREAISDIVEHAGEVDVRWVNVSIRHEKTEAAIRHLG
jgi:hypothetical protein